MKRVFILITFILVANVTIGQHVTLNDSVESFGSQIATYLERTNNQEAASIGQDFNALWPNSFSAQQQSQVMDIAVRLQNRKFASIPYQRDFFGALTSGINLGGLSGTIMDNFLNMLSQSLDKSTPRNFSRELVNLRTFFEHEALHFTRYNSLYAFNADYDFEFIESAGARSYEDVIIEEKEEVEGEKEGDDWGDSKNEGWGDSEDT
ncbi:MAG: hypothetical protein KAI29_16310, partial [Cyclobacteriaceae bacterium]|nr:hypothetical protein [Cyclobacteriaceae bacterium]